MSYQFNPLTGTFDISAMLTGITLASDYGARGDNSTDDTAALQAAIDAASSGKNSIVLLQDGIFRVTGLTLPSYVSLVGSGAKTCVLRFTPTSGNCITLGGASNVSYNSIQNLKIDALTSSSGAAIVGPSDPYYAADVLIDRYEIEGFLRGVYIPYGLHVKVGFGRLIGQGKTTVNGVGVQLGDATLSPVRLVNTASIDNSYISSYETAFISDSSVSDAKQITTESCINSVVCSGRLTILASWIQADTYLITTRPGGQSVTTVGCYFLNGSSVEQGDITSMCNLAGAGGSELGVYGSSFIKAFGGDGLTKVSNVLQAEGYKSSDGSTGATGSFTSADGKTITVKDGLVTNVAYSAPSVTTKTTDYTLTNSDYAILANGTLTLTLPPVASAQVSQFHIKNIGTGVVTIDADGSELIDGDTTLIIDTINGAVDLIPDGSQWRIF